jgi:hypothetical protein
MLDLIDVESGDLELTNDLAHVMTTIPQESCSVIAVLKKHVRMDSSCHFIRSQIARKYDRARSITP